METGITYLKWNDLLAAHFFSPEMAGRTVYLYANEELIAELGRSWGVGVPEFISALKDGPPWAKREGICQKAHQGFQGWRTRALPYPPYIAYLALFVMAAGTDGDFATYAYYPRLRRILGYPDGGMPPSFDRMLDLWSDLELWSTGDKGGELGIFSIRFFYEGWIHVGLPAAQSILTDTERKSLPLIFSNAGVDPTSLPPTMELARALRDHGGRYLRQRTIRLLMSHEDEDLYGILLDVVAEELGEWDGQIVEDIPTTRSTKIRCHAFLRLCLNVDSTARRVNASIRCKLNREFPEDQLVLIGSELSSTLSCEEVLHGWSSCLYGTTTGEPVDAAQFEWAHDLMLKDERLGWQFRLQGRKVHIFVSGAVDGLPGLVETHALPRVSPFYLAYKDDCWSQLETWIRAECLDFIDHHIHDGLPQGWRLASIREATGDSKIRDIFPFLSFSKGVRLRLMGGIRSSLGNHYFSFTPPELYLENADGNEQVSCGGQVLHPMTDKHSYRLPSNLPLEVRIPIEVRRGNTVLNRISFYLTGEASWRGIKPVQEFDRWGMSLNDSTSNQVRVNGAMVTGELPDLSEFKRSASLATALDYAGNGRIFFVGRRPGEIVSWPVEPTPSSWEPIWIIPLRRHGYAIYCGGNPPDCVPVSELVGDKQKVDQWKDILWHRRKLIAPPSHRSLRMLWKQYQEIARGV
jgi:hypothetical protein